MAIVRFYPDGASVEVSRGATILEAARKAGIIIETPCRTFVGNTSKSGGQAFLLNKESRNEMTALVNSIDVMELVGIPEFDKVFVRCLGFRMHTTE